MNTPKKILKGFFYTVGSGYIARIGSLGLTILIRWELGPHIFTDVLKGVTVFMLLSCLREFGLPHALLHYQDRVKEFVSTHFSLNIVITLVASLLNCAIAVALVGLFPEKFSWTVAQVVWVFSALHAVRHLTSTSEALLRMEFEFGRLSLYHGLGTILALLSALLAAKAGWERWSLIVGGWGTVSVFSLVYVLFFSGAVWRDRPLRIWPLQFDPAWTRRLLRYGIWIWIGWMLQTFVWWYDKLVLIFLKDPMMSLKDDNKNALAYYESAWWLVQIPTAIITHIIFTYTNTLYSRYREDRQRLQEYFTLVMSLIVRVSAPLALVFVFNAREVAALLGSEWEASAPILVWLAGYALVRPLLDDGHGLLWALADTQLSARIMAIQAGVALVLVPLLGWNWGVRGVAYSMGAVAGVGVLALSIGLRRYVTVRWRRVFLAPVAALVLASGVGAVYGQWTLDIAPVDFALRSGAMMLVYIATLVAFERTELQEHIAQIRRIMRSSASE